MSAWKRASLVWLGAEDSRRSRPRTGSAVTLADSYSRICAWSRGSSVARTLLSRSTNDGEPSNVDRLAAMSALQSQLTFFHSSTQSLQSIRIAYAHRAARASNRVKHPPRPLFPSREVQRVRGARTCWSDGAAARGGRRREMTIARDSLCIQL